MTELTEEEIEDYKKLMKGVITCTCQGMQVFHGGQVHRLPPTTSEEECLVCTNWDEEEL